MQNEIVLKKRSLSSRIRYAIKGICESANPRAAAKLGYIDMLMDDAESAAEMIEALKESYSKAGVHSSPRKMTSHVLEALKILEVDDLEVVWRCFPKMRARQLEEKSND